MAAVSPPVVQAMRNHFEKSSTYQAALAGPGKGLPFQKVSYVDFTLNTRLIETKIVNIYRAVSPIVVRYDC
jgi:hypothetical protein